MLRVTRISAQSSKAGQSDIGANSLRKPWRVRRLDRSRVRPQVGHTSGHADRTSLTWWASFLVASLGGVTLRRQVADDWNVPSRKKADCSLKQWTATNVRVMERRGRSESSAHAVVTLHTSGDHFELGDFLPGRCRQVGAVDGHAQVLSAATPSPLTGIPASKELCIFDLLTAAQRVAPNGHMARSTKASDLRNDAGGNAIGMRGTVLGAEIRQLRRPPAGNQSVDGGIPRGAAGPSAARRRRAALEYKGK
jgi:hypothetical protein